jgi:hypothetical protein
LSRIVTFRTQSVTGHVCACVRNASCASNNNNTNNNDGNINKSKKMKHCDKTDSYNNSNLKYLVALPCACTHHLHRRIKTHTHSHTRPCCPRRNYSMLNIAAPSSSPRGLRRNTRRNDRMICAQREWGRIRHATKTDYHSRRGPGECRERRKTHERGRVTWRARRCHARPPACVQTLKHLSAYKHLNTCLRTNTCALTQTEGYSVPL